MNFDPARRADLLSRRARRLGYGSGACTEPRRPDDALESNASEHGARMSAMDNATRNAGDMIDDLTMTYNRTRQAVITSELIEIISGAEAL